MNLKKIMAGLLLTLALVSTTVVYAEEAPKSPIAVTTENPDISPESLNLMVRHMTGDELFVEADGWLILLKEAAKKVYDTKLSVQEKNAQIDALKAQDNNQTEAEEREGILQKITVAKEEKAAILEEQTKLRAERKNMVARLDTVVENIHLK